MKARYFPTVNYEIYKTNLGVQESTLPTLYDNPINGKHTIKIDALNALRPFLGNITKLRRDLVYNLFRELSTPKEFKHKAQELCKLSKLFAREVDIWCTCSTSTENFYKEFTEFYRNIIDDYTKEIIQKYTNKGCTVLLNTHDTVYLVSNHIPEIENKEATLVW